MYAKRIRAAADEVSESNWNNWICPMVWLCAMLASMPGVPLNDFQSFESSCQELTAGAQLMLQPVAVQMFRVLVNTEGAAQAGAMFPGGGAACRRPTRPAAAAAACASAAARCDSRLRRCNDRSHTVPP